MAAPTFVPPNQPANVDPMVAALSGLYNMEAISPDGTTLVGTVGFDGKGALYLTDEGTINDYKIGGYSVVVDFLQVKRIDANFRLHALTGGSTAAGQPVTSVDFWLMPLPDGSIKMESKTGWNGMLTPVQPEQMA